MLQIQFFEHHHTQQIVEMILNIQQNEFQVPITLADQPDLLAISSFYQQGHGNFWVALDGGEVVGTIALIDCGEGIGTIRKMFVKASYRGTEHGTAQRLFDALLAWSKTHSFDTLYLGTIERLKAAIRFYERNGFRLISKQNLPPSFPIMVVDAHFFTRNV